MTDGRALLASAGEDKTVRLWDPVTAPRSASRSAATTDSVLSVAFGTGAHGRALLASAGVDETVRLWDPTTGAPVGEPLTGHHSWVISVAFGVGGDARPLLASAGFDGTVRLWEFAPSGSSWAGQLHGTVRARGVRRRW